MPTIVYSREDIVSSKAGDILKGEAAFREEPPTHGMHRYRHGETELIELPGHHLYSDHLDELGTDLIAVLSRHSSSKGVPAFTVHPVGNWSTEAKIGGRPKELGTAAPLAMLKALKALSSANRSELAVTYEATHHGPLLKTPLFYAEVGGNEEVWENAGLLRTLSTAVLASFEVEAPFEKVALGIGGLHYETKFARLALEGKYAFSHMMSKYYVSEVDMLEQAVIRSEPRPEIAAIEWKSLGSLERNRVIEKLNEIGLDHVRV